MASSEARAPRLLVSVNGAPTTGALAAQVTNTSYLSADRFRARFSLSATGAALWATPNLQAEITLGLDGASASMITGDVDRVTIDPIRGEVAIDGRDLSARLISARTQETFENRTASDVATTLAARHGLAAAVAPTGTLVGRYYQNDYVRTTLDQHGRATTEWDLLVWLAGLEGYDVWVAGQTLNFGPAAATTPVIVAPGDCTGMSLDRDIDLEGPLHVTVKSWNGRGQMLVQESASAGGSGASAAITYVIVRPNMTSAAAQDLAQRTLAQITAQGRRLTLDMPGDLSTMPRATLQLVGTGTDFDGNYVVSEVERHLSFAHGFTQSIEARLPAWTAS